MLLGFPCLALSLAKQAGPCATCWRRMRRFAARYLSLGIHVDQGFWAVLRDGAGPRLASHPALRERCQGVGAAAVTHTTAT